jgi:hypothetical protein
MIPNTPCGGYLIRVGGFQCSIIIIAESDEAIIRGSSSLITALDGFSAQPSAAPEQQGGLPPAVIGAIATIEALVVEAITMRSL